MFRRRARGRTRLAGRGYDRVMPRRRSLTSGLYRAARVSNNLSALASGNPRRMARRARNVTVGRALGRAGFWRRLWR